MSRMLQFSLISLLLILSGIGAIVGACNFDTIGTTICLIVISVVLILSGVYFLIFALTFKFGKTVKAKVTNKIYIPVDNDDNIGNSYYRYEYEIVLKNKIKKGKFRIYYIDNDITSTLNVGDDIEVNKFLFITTVDSNKIINDVREANKDNPEYQKMLSEQKRLTRKTFKRDIIVGISIFALIVICCLIYVLSIL